jgi:uncharacterized membrane protein
MEEHGQPPKLDYRGPEGPSRELSKWNVAAGVVLSIVTVGVAVPVVLLASYDEVAHTREWVAWVILLALGGAIGTVGWLGSRSRKWRGFGQGILIGLGVAVLLEGVCFLALMG